MPDVLDMLTRLGLDETSAEMAIPFVWYTAGTTDPYSPAVISIVHGLQGRLARAGIHVRGDGFVDRATSQVLEQLSPAWKSKPWVQVIADVQAALAAGRRPRQALPGRPGLGDSALMEMLRLDHRDLYVKQGTICVPAKGPDSNIRRNLEWFQELQRQINRANAALGQARIPVDGDLGPLTVQAAQRAQVRGDLKQEPTVEACEQLVQRLGSYTMMFKTFADAEGVSKKVASPPAPATTRVVDPGTGRELEVKTAGFSLAGLGDKPVVLFAALGVGGALAVRHFQKRKRKRRK